MTSILSVGSKPIYILFGLSGAGKTTIGQALSKRIENSYILDGDELRKGICSDLQFSERDRTENIRRITHVACLLSNAGIIPILSLIIPLSIHRILIQDIISLHKHIPIFVFVDCPLQECIRRDIKGLYKKALAGCILEFTGITAPFDRPDKLGEWHPPYITIKTDEMSVEKCVELILSSSNHPIIS